MNKIEKLKQLKEENNLTDEQIYRIVKKAYGNQTKLEKKSKGEIIAMERAYFKCLIEKGCGCEKCPRKNNLSLDHIIPKFLLFDMGFDVEKIFFEENYRLLCRPCNNLKSNHLDFSDERTKKLLIKFMNLMEKIE